MDNPFSNLIASSPFEIVFNVNDMDLSIINSLRRIILSELPNVGFFFNPNDFTNKDIDVLHNNTPLHNEFIQHRISLIPINVTIEQLENWNNDDYKFVIDKENNTGNPLNVYTSDIQVFDKNETPLPNLAKQFFPPDPISKDHILITKINPSKSSKFVVNAIATLNTPQVSTSFGMISNMSIEFVVDKKTADKELDKYIIANKEKASVDTLTYQFNSIERERHYFRNKYREPNAFLLSITSECNIPCVYIFNKAISVLKNKIISFQNSNYEIINHNMLFTIIVNNESHTLGNMFQSLVFNHYIRENKDNKFNINYIGYNIPHPLEKILLIKIKGTKLLILDDVREFINTSCDYIYNMLNDLENHWNTLSNK